jgi:polysaccharide export outer membrane protein
VRGAITLVGCVFLGFFCSPICHADSVKNSDVCPSASTTPTAVLDALFDSAQPPFALEPGTSFEISVYGVRDYDIKARVEADGNVNLPLIGKVKLAGLSVSQAEATIAGDLAKSNMIRSPQVSLMVLDSPGQSVSVAGELAHPGTFPDIGRHTLYEMISSAGGFTKTACSVITLNRPSLPNPVQIPMGADPAKSKYGAIPLLPGDAISVPNAGVVYVLGALHSQGPYALKSDSPTTVMDAITMAGGIGYEAAYSSAFVVRDIPEGHERISIDIKKIISGRETDIALQPNDILFVPTSKMKAAVKGGAAGIGAALAAAFIYSHP